jgi:nickel-dependent lactate racemase
MQVHLLYGRDGLVVDFPADLDVHIVRKPPMPLLDDPVAAVAHALTHGVDSPPLARLAVQARTACILVCDITRPVPNHLFLRPVIETLLDAGMAASSITVLVATGLHRPNEGEELAEVIGDRWVLDTVAVENHFARDDAAHVDLGFTEGRRTPVKLDRRFVEADLRIATGLVEPHFMAGWSGGRKVIAPGVAHADTITTFHSARFMEDPAATSCVLTDNPLHEEQLAIVEMIGGAHALNTVIDDERRLSFVNFGEILASHDEAVAHVRQFAQVSVPRRFSTVVTTCAGFPLDGTYYQTVKGMVAALDILAPGGDLIIASSCSEGMGSHHFVDAQRRLVERGPEQFLVDITAKRFADIDEWQTEKLLAPLRVGSVKLFAEGLGATDGALTGVDVIQSVEAAVADSVERHGDRRVAVVPEGPYVIPVYRPSAA